MQAQTTHALIIGASMSGLACAACLARQNIPYIVIEKSGQAGYPWHNHYDRLHLHTNKAVSHLPFQKFERAIPRYPSRMDVFDYLDKYQLSFNINPLFNTSATAVRRENGRWITETSVGVYNSAMVIVATGPFGIPRSLNIKGMETFPGALRHSFEYRNAAEFRDKRVLVIGFGNSACEIALNLCEQGIAPSMSVRSAVNVVPRDILGIPIVSLSRMLNILPPRVADIISKPLIHAIIGNINRLGLRKSRYGAIEQINKFGTAPVIDIGTVRQIRQGNIIIHSAICEVKGAEVHFSEGTVKEFDAIISAIGYEHSFPAFMQLDKKHIEDLKLRIDKQKYFGNDGLYFCGFHISPTGQINEIARDAKFIARDIGRKKYNQTQVRIVR